MTRDEVDIMWQQAMQESIKDGEMFTRYHFAELVEDKVLAQPHETTLKEFNQLIHDDPKYHIWAKEKEALAEHAMQEVQRLGQEIEQEPIGWKLMPRDATNAMLKAMDECSTEGYDERLYAGHAASVYMAAWDEAPTPPQRTWVELTEQQQLDIFAQSVAKKRSEHEHYMAIEQALKERNQ